MDFRYSLMRVHSLAFALRSQKGRLFSDSSHSGPRLINWSARPYGMFANCRRAAVKGNRKPDCQLFSPKWIKQTCVSGNWFSHLHGWLISSEWVFFSWKFFRIVRQLIERELIKLLPSLFAADNSERGIGLQTLCIRLAWKRKGQACGDSRGDCAECR